MKIRRWVGVVLLGMGLSALGCSADRQILPVGLGADASVSTASAVAFVESPAAVARLADLRARFRFAPPVATQFAPAEGSDAPHVVAVIPSEALRGISRAARVGLPVRADGEVTLEDDTSHLSVRFALERARNARIEVAGGMALYRGALDGADVVHRVHAEGTEDFVVFETRPAREELSYVVDVSRVPGLRLVSNTLEFLDESGTPVLRVAPPYVVDATGVRHEARLAVDGCAYDTNPAGPWGRAVTKSGAEHCTVRVAWAGGIAYPALVDPAWVATGSMATARELHTASVLPSGRVLVVGGYDGSAYLTSAELYDPAGNAGAGTFAATGSMATGRELHTASVLPSGKVLVVGGYHGTSPYLASAELYDPTGPGTFAATASMSTPRDGHTASVLPSGKVLVAGGMDGVTGSLTSAELFDPAGNAGAGTFAATGSMSAGRFRHTATVLLSGKVLVAGGSGTLASAELYDPAGNAGAGTFAATGSMGTARYLHTASLLPSGKVLVVGGSAGVASSLASAELFDPAGNAGAGSFAATGSMATKRGFGHTASVLPFGKVLVAGGNDAQAQLASAELFDPAGNAGAGSFAALGSTTARESHTASVLPSGKVLVAGGRTNVAPYFLASAELVGGTQGDACTAGYCLSGFCVDGFCCDKACDGTCLACAAALKFSGSGDGTCDIAKPGPDPGGGVCTAPKGTCEGDHVLVGIDNTKQDCAPYKCLDGACRQQCTSVNDCVAPTICDSAGQCVPPSAATASDGGCAISAASSGEPSWIASLAAAAGLALVRRRRKGVVGGSGP